MRQLVRASAIIAGYAAGIFGGRLLLSLVRARWARLNGRKERGGRHAEQPARAGQLPRPEERKIAFSPFDYC